MGCGVLGRLEVASRQDRLQQQPAGVTVHRVGGRADRHRLEEVDEGIRDLGEGGQAGTDVLAALGVVGGCRRAGKRAPHGPGGQEVGDRVGGPDGIQQGRIGADLAQPRQGDCLLYTSPSPRDLSTSRMPSSA